MRIVGMIPARMGSSRFPGKPLEKICGVSMIEHVYHRCIMSKILSDVYVATCDVEIQKAVKSFGGKVIMTKDTHDRASDRVAEAMLKVEDESNTKIDILVMIQGDEPLIFPEMIDAAVQPIIDDDHIFVTNLMAPIQTEEEQNDRNEIKVVVDNNNYALYFSREPIPTRAKTEGFVPMNKQVCIIPFKRENLLKFNALEQTQLEIVESVDMMRVLENGDKVKMVPTQFETYSVDTQEDLQKVEGLMIKDSLFKLYKNDQNFDCRSSA